MLWRYSKYINGMRPQIFITFLFPVYWPLPLRWSTCITPEVEIGVQLLNRVWSWERTNPLFAHHARITSQRCGPGSWNIYVFMLCIHRSIEPLNTCSVNIGVSWYIILYWVFRIYRVFKKNCDFLQFTATPPSPTSL